MQDTASALCVQALDARPGQTVLDVCAAPGGKTFTVAEQMQNKGKIIAFDLYPHRVSLIETGKINPTILRVLDIARVLKVDINALTKDA